MKLLNLSLLSLIAVSSATTPPAPQCETCQVAPDKNRCDITTSCTFVWGHTDANTPAPYYCACRHGYRTFTLQSKYPVRAIYTESIRRHRL
jgi:hypothetical protein